MNVEPDAIPDLTDERQKRDTQLEEHTQLAKLQMLFNDYNEALQLYLEDDPFMLLDSTQGDRSAAGRRKLAQQCIDTVDKGLPRGRLRTEIYHVYSHIFPSDAPDVAPGQKRQRKKVPEHTLPAHGEGRSAKRSRR